MKKRLLSVFLSVALILGLLPGTAWAAGVTSGRCGTNTTWSFNESTGKLTISGTGATDDYAYSWGSNAPWAAYQDDIKSVYIESGVTRIGEGAFGGDMRANGYENLVAVTFPNTLESIGTYAFAGSSLTSINLPSNLKTIEDGAFNYTKLTMVSLPTSLTAIGGFAFPDTLISVRIPASVTKIGGGAFGSSTSITVDAGNRSYVAEDNVLYNIGKTEIICVGSLNATHYTIPATVKTVDLSEFWYAPKLERITIPAGVELTNYLCPPEGFAPDVSQNLALYFYGNAPSELDNGIGTLRNGEWACLNIYYISGTSGWEEYLQQDYSEPFGVPYMTFATWTPGDTTSPSIQKLYPTNGATEVGYGANSPKKFQITFDREIVNDGSIAKVDLSKPGAFSIYRALDNQPVYQSTQYSTYNFLIVYQQENILSIASTELDPGTEYYITLDAGIVAFKDGTTNQAISKGDWGFSTKLFEKKGDFSYLSNDGYDTKYGYSYSDSYFEGLSNKYNHELANMSISLALSAFNSASSLTSGYEHTTAAKNVRALLSDIKFDNLETSSYAGRPGKDTIGVAFGKKEVSYSSGDYTLVAVAIRGAGYEAEWGGNLTVGRKGNHTGFQTAADTVLSRLKEYIKDQEISGDLKIWVTGYSRAAATANLVAAALDDGELFSGANPVSRSSVSLKRTDIYAYTFETPMATTNSNSSAYDNIFNIVNPIDPVPKVAPEGWDFTRYGVTYYMPTSEELTFNDYHNIILRVNTEYANIIKVTPGSSSSFIKALSNQGTILNNFLNYLSIRLPRDTYSPGYEDLIAPIIAEITNSGKTDAEAIASIVLEFCVRHPKEAKTIIDALEDAVGMKAYWVVVEQGFEQFYKLLGWEGTTATEVITLLFDTITQSHIPEVTLAWMRTINGADEYGSGMARKLYVNCPVDVSVYDSSDQLVAQIIDDEPQLIDDSLISAYVDGSGQKIIILPNNEKYRIVLTATNDGTVTYTATEYSLDTGNSDRVVSYYEVEVINGDELTAIAENLNEVSFAEYPLYLNDSNKSLEPTINQIGDDVVEHTVAVTVLGNGETSGGGSYISGEFARVTAEPNSGENFLGWYVNNNLVSSDAEYRFLVEKNINITAKFTENIPTTPDAPSNPNPPVHPNPNYPSNGGGGITPATNEITVPSTAGGTVIVSPKSASKGNTVTITATPDPGYELVSLTVTGADGTIVDVSNVGDGKYTFTMPSGKVTVNTVFSKTWSNPFSDVDEGAWYYDAVKFANQNGLMDGVGNGLFAPNANLSRAMLAQILYNKEGKPNVTVASSFSDVVAGAWYANAVTWAATKNIVGGYGNGLFGPGDDITREQFAVILYRYAGSPVPPNLLLDFTDAYKVSSWAQDAIRWAVDQGILNGKGNGILDPTGKATRAEAAQMLKNYFGK